VARDGTGNAAFGTLVLSLLAIGGIVHTDVSGLLSSSLIVNADVSAAAAIADTKLGTISAAGKVLNSATTATSANTPSAIVARDGSGNAVLSNVTLQSFATTGIVHNNSSGVLSASLIVDADVASSAAIVDTKLQTISTAGKVLNSATTATSANTAFTIVARDGSGNIAVGGLTTAGVTTLGDDAFSRAKFFVNTTETQLGANTTLTTTQLLGKLIVGTNGILTTITLTYPSAAALVTAVPGVQVGDTFWCLFQTVGAGAIAFAAGTGVTFRRNANINSPNSAIHYIRFANVTGGAEAVVVFQ
jgi:hypothetical protein